MSQATKKTILLGIETSCDETAVAVVEHTGKDSVRILSNIVSSQIALHASYGGVVPNLAAREHEHNMPTVLEEALRTAHLTPKDIDAIAVTNGPGLIPALLVGTATARTLSFLWKKPLLGIHHIEGHIYANFIGESKGASQKAQENPIPTFNLQIPNSNLSSLSPVPCPPSPDFPILALVVSGGHTQLVLMREHFSYEIIGETQDDAVGEAFDKVARILGLGYPGGPAVAAAALEATRDKGQGTSDKRQSIEKKDFESPISEKISKIPTSKFQIPNSNPSSPSPVPRSLPPTLPRPMLHSGDFHFSFSGLKTAVLYTAKKFREAERLNETDPLPKTFVSALCGEFQQAAVDVLVKKTIRAAKKHDVKTVILAGGVSANTELRNQLEAAVSECVPSATCHLSPIALSTDNAAMIATAGAFRFARMTDDQKTAALSAWKILPTRATTPLPSKENFTE